MNTIFILFLLRIVIPVVILLSIGEWMKIRDADYWR